MHYVNPFIKMINLTTTKYPSQKNTEDNFCEVQTTKCTKTLYQTGTIRPPVFPIVSLFLALVNIYQLLSPPGN